jgi:hypothetical protein
MLHVSLFRLIFLEHHEIHVQSGLVEGKSLATV